MTRAAVVLLALGLSACSALLSPEGHPIACMGTGADDTCIPFGMVCVNAFCEPGDGGVGTDACVPAPELCDGRDNDCNGVIDDGADADGDGYTWCGGGVLSQRDCNDMDPTVHPGAAEVCDGKDNDCNGTIDDQGSGAPLCPSGQTCFQSIGACHAEDCTVAERACATGLVCDTMTGPTPTCVSGTDCRMSPALCTGGARCNMLTGACVTPAPIGAPCTSDDDCSSTLCVDNATLGLPGGGRVCGAACCSDRQCPMGTICWAPGNGARSCLPPAMVGRSATGSGTSGANCSGDDTACVSGLCGSSHDGCIGGCSNTSECGGLVCTVSSPVPTPANPDYFSLSCVSPDPSGADVGGTCCGDTDCKSGVCYGWMDTWLGCVPGACAEGCRTNDDCGTGCGVLRCQGYCGNLRVTIGSGSSVVQMCIYRTPGASGSSPSGASCSDGGSCRSNYCEGGTCHDTCCIDADCQPYGLHCRPGTGTYPTMRCR